MHRLRRIWHALTGGAAEPCREAPDESAPRPLGEDEALLIAGAALVHVVTRWNAWVYRRVDSVHPLVGERGRRRQSLDCLPTPDPALAFHPDERGFTSPHDLRGQIMVPLAYIKKEPLREFDARGPDGSILPVLGAADTIRYGVAMVRSELMRTNLDVPEALIPLIEEIVGPARDEKSLADVDKLVTSGRWLDGVQVDPRVFDGNDAGELLRMLVGRFLLIGLIDSQRAGSRQVLKYSYDWHVEGLPPKHFFLSLKVAFGWSRRTIEVPLEAASAAASYHLEFQTPPEARCTLLRLPGESGPDSLFDDSRKPVTHVHGQYDQQPEESGELVMDLPFRGIRMTATVAAAFSFLTTLLALLLPGAEAVWRSEPEGPATVLLVAPAVLLALVASRGESALVREPMNILRFSVLSSAVSLFLVAASLVGELQDGWLQALWWGVTVWNGILFTALLIGRQISEKTTPDLA